MKKFYMPRCMEMLNKLLPSKKIWLYYPWHKPGISRSLTLRADHAIHFSRISLAPGKKNQIA